MPKPCPPCSAAVPGPKVGAASVIATPSGLRAAIPGKLPSQRLPDYGSAMAACSGTVALEWEGTKFIGPLQQHEITVVADVRSAPYSRYNPQFNQDSLASLLKEQGGKYLFFGKEPGARVGDPQCYIDGQIAYSLLAARPEFKQAIARLIKGYQGYRIALMCVEQWPLVCHRTLLVAQALANANCDILHILADGALEQHQELLQQWVL